MPIRINLLAEAQTLEEQRRQDPVKRAILAAAGVIIVVLAWLGMLIWQGAVKQSDLAQLQAHLKKIKPRHDAIKRNDVLTIEAQRNVESLQFYCTNRFLWAPTLNTLAQVATNGYCTNITFSRLGAEQVFESLPAVKLATNAAGQVVTPARPQGIAERNRLVIDARDYSPDREATHEKYRRALIEAPYFKAVLSSNSPVALLDWNKGNPDLLQPGSKPFQAFVLQCQFAEKFRTQ